MNAQFFKKIGFKGQQKSIQKGGSKKHMVKASSRIKRNNNLGKEITYKDAVVLLRKKLKKYKAKVEQESAVNKELARRLAEYKAKYEEEKKALELMTADCATWRKFAMTLQVHPNNDANRRHNLGENAKEVLPGNDLSPNQSNTPSSMYISGHSAALSQRQVEIDEQIQELESTFHTIWDIPSSELLDRCSDLFDSFFICGAPVLDAFEAFDAAPGSKHVLSKCRTPYFRVAEVTPAKIGTGASTHCKALLGSTGIIGPVHRNGRSKASNAITQLLDVYSLFDWKIILCSNNA